MSLDAVWLQRWDELQATAEKEDLPFLGPADPQEALARFEAVQSDAGHYAERCDFPVFVAAIKALHTPAE